MRPDRPQFVHHPPNRPPKPPKKPLQLFVRQPRRREQTSPHLLIRINPHPRLPSAWFTQRAQRRGEGGEAKPPRAAAITPNTRRAKPAITSHRSPRANPDPNPRPHPRLQPLCVLCV